VSALEAKKLSEKVHDVIVLGAGISGLSFALFAAQAGRRCLVLEAEDRVGGCLHSERLDTGYWYELGAHTCYNSYGTFIDLIEERSLSDRIIPRKKAPFKMLRDGTLRSIARELNFFELLRSAPRLFKTKKPGRTVQSYFSAFVGAKNYQNVLGHFLSAVPSQRADELPADLLFKKRPRRKDIIKSYSLAGGLQTLPDSIADDPRITTLRSTKVASVEKSPEGRFVVTTVDGQTFESPQVVLALHVAAATEVVAAFPALAEALGALESVQVDSVGVVVNKERLALENVAGIVPADDLFFSAVSRDPLPDAKYRAFSFHFKPGHSLDTRLDRITSVLGIERGDLLAIREKRVVLPSPRLGHGARAAAIEKAAHDAGLFVTGNYFAGMAIEDCVKRSSIECARMLARI